ncbi:hypothetical protein SPF06_04970 [Sinomonas sp. JGH33]|uniref:Polyketide antibiotic transporter n=1 Tax=Sinomonas terricola TaxID=3110330 RepID=A0ABU5T3C2_9MICC|nr:hypothetical protein [Sinomonas sp. JGH33]MEA5454070.1 hypothetical protein [Sinomonas sp. JGH33]
MGTLWILYRQRLRRDRWQLVIWVLAIGLLALLSVSTIAKTYGDEASRAEVLRLATATPAILMLRGLARGPGEGAFTFFALFAFLALLAAFMSTFLAVRHTRAEEESGRAELISATPAGRWAPLLATIVHGLLANVLIAAAITGGLVAGGLPAAGSLVAGAAAGAVGIAFLGVGLLSAEFMSTSRGANGTASAVVMTAYILRGFGDSTGRVGADGMTMTAAWPSWLSPIGWGQQTFAFTGDRWWPLLLPLALGAGCVAAVVLLMTQRDVGASVLAGRASRPDARRSLRGPISLAMRLQQGAVIGWCIGGLATGLLAGALGAAIQQSVSDNPSITNALRAMIQAQGTSMTQLLISALFSFGGVLAAACALQAVIRLRQEESAGTAAWVLAQPLGRARWFAGFLIVGTSAVVLVMGFAALGAWASLVASGDTSRAVGDVWQTAAGQVPAALIYLALPGLVFVVWPRGTAPLGWGLLTVGVMVGIYGGMIGLDQSVRDLSPFTHAPVPGSSGADWSGGFWMLGISAVLVAVSLAAVRRREIGSA